MDRENRENSTKISSLHFCWGPLLCKRNLKGRGLGLWGDDKGGKGQNNSRGGFSLYAKKVACAESVHVWGMVGPVNGT